jgi:hypothetical protein
MADKKISQLPASTTPVAGTEELAIVQSGDTKKVSINNLTDGKLVKMSQLAVGAVASPTLLAELFSSTAPTLRISNGGGASPAPMISLYRASGTEAQIYYDPSSKRLDFNNVFAGGAIRFLQGNGVVAEFDSSGNFAPTAGRGISFAATGQAAGMTSELLSDYEEGTWTPLYRPASGSFTSVTMDIVQTAYTKVGRLVTAQAWIRTDELTLGTGTGVLEITGLPFTPGRNVAGSIAYTFGYSTAVTSATLRSDTANYLQTNIPVTSLTVGTSANKNEMMISISYIV